MSSNPTYLKYPHFFQTYERKILSRKDEWSLMFRIQSQLPTNNVNVSEVKCHSELKKISDSTEIEPSNSWNF